MELDRYKQNHRLYVMGIISLILCLSFFFFSMYIIPFLLWGEHYDVPEFITTLHTFFLNQQFTSATSSFIVWLIFFIPCLIAGFISYRISNHIDDRLLGVKNEVVRDKPVRRADSGESLKLSLKIFSLMVLIVLAILFLQFILY